MPLRVIGGELGGRVLRGPPRSGVRPTTDRVREALFEILTACGAPMRRVLDLYSGTGAMGIEAMSRGGEWCDFVESDAKACEVIRENLRRTGLQGRAKLWPMTVARAISRLREESGKAADATSADVGAPTPLPDPLPSRIEGNNEPEERRKGYDLVVADPPYEYNRAEAELALVLESGLLVEGGTLVVEHSQRREWPGMLGSLVRMDSRRYGDTRVTLYGRG
ncbi:MAG TPA: RsmD family RNA methyltransferase [Dehalococcoidia bacterium]|nr:RsmD family RNA methyltransferase [Dehalococcoidia bacterium]